MTTRTRPDCHEKAAALLARRPHFRAQLAGKLSARGYADDEIEAALDRLVSYGYLDDARTAADFVEQKLARGPVGRRRLAAELARRGAPSEAIDGALAELPDEREAARAAAARWNGRGGPAALGRRLDRLGFGAAVIRELLEEVSDDGGPPGPFGGDG